MATPNLALLEKKIRFKFENADLLQEAMTHKSYSIEHATPSCNERMEFLGDSIIAAVVANWLFEKFPNVDEGKLSKMKSQIVSRNNLSVWAEEWDLGEYLFLSQGEEATGGRKRESLLGNAYEALVGAIFIDQGFEPAEKFVLKHLAQRKRIVENDFKSKLQEVVQKKYKMPPSYVVIAEAGPDHEKKFTLEVRIKQRLLGTGEGRSKKEAEQMAAKEALKIMKNS
jgi:ribonuclease-3